MTVTSFLKPFLLMAVAIHGGDVYPEAIPVDGCCVP